MRRRDFLLACLGLPALARAARFAPGEEYRAPAGVGRDLIGTRPPELEIESWLQSPPLTLAQLKGKVVLIRWWTGPQCPYCAASADALNALWEKDRARGLVVIGLYHHKTSEPLTRAHVEAQVRKLGFQFPVGIDNRWRNLRRWWLEKEPAGWTSVSFLLDRQGIIRHVHPGGAYFAGEPGYASLVAAVEEALRSPI